MECRVLVDGIYGSFGGVVGSFGWNVGLLWRECGAFLVEYKGFVWMEFRALLDGM